MSWWVWLIILLLLGLFVFDTLSNVDKHSKKKNSIDDKSSEEIANEITTIAQFRSLEKKVERADAKRMENPSYNSSSQRAEDRADERYWILQKAFELADKKILRWQLIPKSTLNISLKIAKSAYKIFPSIDEDLCKNKEEWYGLRGDEEPDEKDDEMKFIIKFRMIIENTTFSSDEKSKKINSLVSRNIDVASVFFDVDSKVKASKQWDKMSIGFKYTNGENVT